MFCFVLRDMQGFQENLTQVDTQEFKPEKRMKKCLPSRKQKKNILDLSLKEPDITVKPLHFNDEKI